MGQRATAIRISAYSMSSKMSMTSADLPQPDDTTALLTFPCVFPIKVMGAHAETFPALVLDLIKTQQPQFDATEMDARISTGGRYISLTCQVEVHSQMQLDAIYRVLSGHPLVKYVL